MINMSYSFAEFKATCANMKKNKYLAPTSANCRYTKILPRDQLAPAKNPPAGPYHTIAELRKN